MNKGMKTRIYPTSRKLVGLCGDVAIITLTYMFLTCLIVSSGVHEMYHTLYSGMLPVTIILTVMIFSINGLYTIEYRHFSEVLISLAVSLFLVLILVMALSFVIHEFAYSRVLIISSTVMQFILLGFWKRAVQRWEQSLHPVRHVMIIGNEDECRHVYYRMSAQPQLKMKLQHVIMDPKTDWRKELEICDVDTLIICSDIPITTKASIVNYCTDKEIQPYIIPSSYEIFCNGAMLQKIDDVPVFRPKSLRLSVEQRAVKRTVDIIVAGMAAICACPSLFPSHWLSSSATVVPFFTVRSASDALARNIKSTNSVPCASMQKNIPVPSWRRKTTRALPKSANSSAPLAWTNCRRSSTSSTET